MRLGVVFPQIEIGDDPAVIKEYVQTAEGAGYDHVLVYDHVLGAPPERFEFRPPYTHETPFHEPFVLFGFIAGVTTRLEMTSGIVILPQRQTALVAKQAAEVDVLSGGRLRLGVGIGWNHVEYEALGENFRNRGRRVEEQIDLLRRLWTEELVDYDGKWHRIHQAGIRPLPVQRPIPVWMGAMAEPAIRRAATIADGWFPQFRPDRPESAAAIERLHGYLRDAGRRVEDFGVEGRISLFNTPEGEWVSAMQGWRDLGATHVSFNTMGVGLDAHGHIDAIRRFREVTANA